MTHKWTQCMMLALAICIAQVAQGQLITNLERSNSQNGEPQRATEALAVGGAVFVDRTHQYIELPESLLGLEYAMLANNDKVSPSFQLHVTLARSATLYLFLDNRIGDNNGDNPPALGGGVMRWVVDMGFTTTYERIGVDEKGTGVPNGWYTVYKLEVPAGTTTLLEQDDGGSRRMYNIAVWAPSLTADDPTPENGAVDVPLDALLSWAPGANAETHDVYLGTVLEDVSDASRASPLGVLVGENEDTNTFDATGLLVFGETYYWRVDGVSADNTVTRGMVWQFDVESIGYPIAGDLIWATASSFQAGYGPENTINGSGLNERDEHSTAAGDMWQSEAETGSAWIQYAFDRVYKLDALWVWNYNGDLEWMAGLGLKDVTIEYSLDAESWAVLGDYVLGQGSSAADYTANTRVDFDGVTAQYVRLMATSSFGERGWYGLSEVRFLCIPTYARRPEPASGETDVATEAILTWRAGRDAVSHEVYLSDDEQAVVAGTPFIETVGVNQYDLSGLDLLLDTRYYWKINGINEAEAIVSWEGDVWSFTTQVSYAVDSFESYNDNKEAGMAIWQTWEDGFDVNGNGSQVGHYPGPYAERTIVREGLQSMPFYYVNTPTDLLSEAVRTFEPGEDWTRGGVQALVLYFQGQTDNTGGQMYVKINDFRIDYTGDVSDLSKPFWIQWTIDLAAVALETDLTNVRTMSIGVDNGGRGTLFFDDLRLYRVAPEPARAEVWIEAEAADSLVSPMRIYSDQADAWGGAYIATFGDNSSGDPPDNGGVASYTVALDGGTYRIVGRVIAPTGNDDSFWVRFEGATTNTVNHASGWIRWALETGEDWHDVAVRSMDDESATVLFTVEPGLYNLEIAYREDGALLDAWMITQQPAE